MPPPPQQSNGSGGNGISLRGGNLFWNLASAGRYQPDGEGLVKVSRLRLVTIELGSDEGTYLFSAGVRKLSG